MSPIHVKANRPFRMPDRLAETKGHLPDVCYFWINKNTLECARS